MMTIIKLFWDICLFKRGPQDVPYDKRLFNNVLTLNIVFSSLHLWMFMSLEAALVYSLVLLALSTSIIWILLRFKNQSPRFRQTITSIWGVDIILTLFGGLMVWLEVFLRNQLSFFLTLVWFAFLIWAVSISANILRQALNISRFLAILMALVLLLINNGVLNILMKSGIL